jgi:hypothetical protein
VIRYTYSRWQPWFLFAVVSVLIGFMEMQWTWTKSVNLETPSKKITLSTEMEKPSAPGGQLLSIRLPDSPMLVSKSPGKNAVATRKSTHGCISIAPESLTAPESGRGSNSRLPGETGQSKQ